MKYGVRVTNEDGTVQYAYAAKGGYISVTDDINNTALFEQEESAIRAVKAARKFGYESKLKCKLDVVGIDYTVVKVTEVERPKKKAGFHLTAIKEEMAFGKPREKQIWFSGPKKANSRIDWSDAIEAATVFTSDTECYAKIAEAREEHLQDIEKKKRDLAKGYPYYGHVTPKDKAEWEARMRSNIDHDTARTAWFDTIQVVPT
ncbi:hypothetical protein D3C75_343240 [compost metagenome]